MLKEAREKGGGAIYKVNSGVVFTRPLDYRAATGRRQMGQGEESNDDKTRNEIFCSHLRLPLSRPPQPPPPQNIQNITKILVANRSSKFMLNVELLTVGRLEPD